MDMQKLHAKIAELEAQADILRTVAAAWRDPALGPALRSLFTAGGTTATTPRRRSRRAAKAATPRTAKSPGRIIQRLRQVFLSHTGPMTVAELRVAMTVESQRVHQWMYQYKANIRRHYTPAVSPLRYYSWVEPAALPASQPPNPPDAG